MSPDILPDFQNYLNQRQLASAKHTPYFAYWAARFIDFAAQNPHKDVDILIHDFL